MNQQDYSAWSEMQRDAAPSSNELRMEKLDIDMLYDEAEAAGRFGVCANCEEEHILCFCGVCFKYCHDNYDHAEMTDPMDETLLGLV